MSADEASPGENGSRFYQGRIKRLLRGSESGVVRSTTGREVPFEFRHVVMRGPFRRFDDLREGMSVGFDVGWTSSGLRVTVLYAGPRPGSEGQSGTKEQVAAHQLADGGPEDGDVE